MQEYNFSKYNLFFEYENYYIILNTLSKKIIKTNIEKKNTIEVLKKTKIINLDDDFVKYLYNKGIIIDIHYNELDIIKEKCNKLVVGDLLDLNILVSYMCNFDCVYCFQKHLPNSILSKEKGQLILNFLEKNLGNYKKLYINWFGGEPLVAKQMLIYLNSAIKNISKQKKVPYVARITTNGYELDLETFNNLVRNNVFVYYVSIDGTKETHDVQRPHKNGKGSYEVIINNLINIKEHAKTKNYRIDIRVNNSKLTMKNTDKFLDEYNKLFGNDHRFNLVIDKINHWSEKTEDIKAELLHENDITKIGNKAKVKKIELSHLFSQNLETQICQAAKQNGYIINYDGTIHKCQMAMESNVNKSKGEIGYITNNGDLYIDKEKENLWIKSYFDKACYECVALPICLGKKCIYTKNIENKNCESINEKLINSIKIDELSYVDKIPYYEEEISCMKI